MAYDVDASTQVEDLTYGQPGVVFGTPHVRAGGTEHPEEGWYPGYKREVF